MRLFVRVLAPCAAALLCACLAADSVAPLVALSALAVVSHDDTAVGSALLLAAAYVHWRAAALAVLAHDVLTSNRHLRTAMATAACVLAAVDAAYMWHPALAVAVAIYCLWPGRVAPRPEDLLVVARVIGVARLAELPGDEAGALGALGGTPLYAMSALWRVAYGRAQAHACGRVVDFSAQTVTSDAGETPFGDEPLDAWDVALLAQPDTSDAQPDAPAAQPDAPVVADA